METLLTKIRAALHQERYAFLTLEENVQKCLSKDDDQQVEIAIAPVLGIYRIEANDYWTEDGKNVSGWDYCWGHWRCFRLDRLNQNLEHLFLPVAVGTVKDNHYFGKYEEGKGLRFRFEPGDLQPAKADRVENKERIYGWFEGKRQPDTLFLPHATAEEIVGIVEERNSKRYRIFPSYRSEVAAKQSEKSRLVDGLERTITIMCYPSKEFYEEKNKLMRQRSLESKKSIPHFKRERIERYEEKLRELGVVLGNDRAISIPNYNQHFKGKPNYF